MRHSLHGFAARMRNILGRCAPVGDLVRRRGRVLGTYGVWGRRRSARRTDMGVRAFTSLHFSSLLFFLHLLLSPDTYFCLCSHLPCPCCRRDECLSPLDLGRLWERGRGFSSFIIRYSKFHVWVAGLLGQCRYPGFFWSGREECRFTRYRWRGGTGWGRGGSRATALGGHCT